MAPGCRTDTEGASEPSPCSRVAERIRLKGLRCRCSRPGARWPRCYSDEQIAFSLRQAESGISVDEICRKLGISEPTFYRWKKQYAGMGVPEIRRLKQLEDENSKLKTLVADLTLARAMLQDVLRRKW